MRLTLAFASARGPGGVPSGIFKSPLACGDLGRNPLNKIRILYISFTSFNSNSSKSFTLSFRSIGDGEVSSREVWKGLVHQRKRQQVGGYQPGSC